MVGLEYGIWSGAGVEYYGIELIKLFKIIDPEWRSNNNEDDEIGWYIEGFKEEHPDIQIPTE